MADIDSAKSALSASSKMIDDIRSRSSIISHVKVYTNILVREGSTKGNTDGLINHISAKFENDINKLKTDKGKERKAGIRDELIKYLKDNESKIDEVFKLHSFLSEIKTSLVRKLEKIKGIGTFVRTDDGFKATAPEGFVAVDRISNKALKLVDRLEFSRANFTVAKNWVKG